MVSIHVTHYGPEEMPLTIEVFGLSVSFSGLAPGSAVTVSEGNGGLTVSVGGGEKRRSVSPDGRSAEAPAQEEAAPEPAREEAEPEQEGGQELFQKLSALRKKISSETGLPHYVVFHDNTLKEMCRVLPADAEALGAVQGVGKAKLEKYGALFIAAIREHTGAAASAV